ncbi:MAG TPA: ABC transporter ATP-binding protein, partial [Trueperaceae bacterium]
GRDVDCGPLGPLGPPAYHLQPERYSGRVMPVLSARRLVKSYPTAGGSLEVLKGLSFVLNAGEISAVLGPSGSGKSTLLHLLGGLDRPTTGDVFWGDTPLRNLGRNALARARAGRLGLVFQQHYLLADLSALDNVLLSGRILGRPERDRAEALLARVGLAARQAALPSQLSGGERQRVAVARALYAKPPMILADEPTGSLDRHNAREVYGLLVELAREEGSAVLMVTHDEGLVWDVDRRYRLCEGVLVPA